MSKKQFLITTVISVCGFMVTTAGVVITILEFFQKK